MSTVGRRKKDKDKDDDLQAINKLNQYGIELANKLRIKQFGFEIQEHMFLDGKEKAKRRAALLNRFGATIQELKEKNNLSESVIIFGKRYGIDGKGRLVLHVDGTPQDWLQQLLLYTPQNSKMAIKKCKIEAATGAKCRRCSWY